MSSLENISRSYLEFPQGFDILKKAPVDSRSIFTTIAERDALQAGQRYHGLFTFVQSDSKFYYLKSGLTNDDWEEVKFNVDIPSSPIPIWKKLTLPSLDKFTLVVTENTHPDYVYPDPAPVLGVEPYPKGFFKVILQVKGELIGDDNFERYYEIAEYEALFFHKNSVQSDSGSRTVGSSLVPLTPLRKAFVDTRDQGKTGTMFEMVDDIGTNGKVGFKQTVGSQISSMEVSLFYPSEIGELDVTAMITT